MTLFLCFIQNAIRTLFSWAQSYINVHNLLIKYMYNAISAKKENDSHYDSDYHDS